MSDKFIPLYNQFCLRYYRQVNQLNTYGGMPEWLIGAVLKTVVRASVPRVRIPIPPPFKVTLGWLFCLWDSMYFFMIFARNGYLLTGHFVGRVSCHCEPVKAKQSSFCRFNLVGSCLIQNVRNVHFQSSKFQNWKFEEVSNRLKCQ